MVIKSMMALALTQADTVPDAPLTVSSKLCKANGKLTNINSIQDQEIIV